MQKSPFYLLFSPDTKNEFPGNIVAPSLRLLRAPMAFSPSSSTRGLFAIIIHPWRRRPRRRGRSKLPTQHILSPAQRRRGAVATFAPHTSGFFAIIIHPWPFRHHRTPVATAPSPSRPFPASNTAYHPHSDGEAPSLRLLRTPMAFSPSSPPVAFSPSSSTRGDGALAVAADPSFQHGISSAQRRRGAVAT